MVSRSMLLHAHAYPQATTPMPTVRRILRVRGTVQGVGFRPFVHRLASELSLSGFVRNAPDLVLIDLEGSPEGVAAFESRLVSERPAHASVENVQVENADPAGRSGFVIATSEMGEVRSARVSADLATCAPCLCELQDPADRRFSYAFINCTDCGPRYSISFEVPYDRSRTTMAAFTMCGACAFEYTDPTSRRFHAQPNACPQCGPRLWTEPGGTEDPIVTAVRALKRGDIVAAKGLGGFHLVCDATSVQAVRRLRERKRRWHKPFAVMFEDLEAVGRAAVIDDVARAALVSSCRPIVLLPVRSDSALDPDVSPGLNEVGAFLPATPLQHLLLRAHGGPLVMTSGNISDEPIVTSNEEARTRLKGIADLMLMHDRDIHMREDDSVVRVIHNEARVFRRSRGFVPEAIPLGFDAPPLLAVGADLKNALCLTTGDAAVLSQHIGDMENPEAQGFFSETRSHLERLFGVRPLFVAHDLHPGYHTTRLAQRAGLQAIAVQHHHAHIASCLVDNGRTDRVIGVAWDGTGYGPDETVWGGEFLVADLDGFRRVARIRPVPMPGGDAAVREPWRMALAHAFEAGVALDRGRHPTQAVVLAMLRRGVQCVPTSSAGRLFDAVASLVGLRSEAMYEGQAAMELESIATEGEEPYSWALLEPPEMIEIDFRPLVRAVVEEVERGESIARIAGRFHATLAEALVATCRRIREHEDLSTVALSGGCFQNRLLTESTASRLAREGFEVLLHSRVPCGDGGIALGQAAVAGWRLRHVSGNSR